MQHIFELSNTIRGYFSLPTTYYSEEEMGNYCFSICDVPQTVTASSLAATANNQPHSPRIENGPQRNNTAANNNNFIPIPVPEESGDEAGMVTPLQRQHLEEQNYINSKYLDKSKSLIKVKSEVGFKDAGAGELCEICNSHEKTHFAIPCGHAACLTCWSRWLYSKPVSNINSDREERRNENCFVCHRKVMRIKRYSLSIVPLKLYENKPLDFTSSELTDLADSLEKESENDAEKRQRHELRTSNTLAELEIAIDDSLERVVHSLLDIKDDLSTKIVKKLEDVELHLFGLTLTPDTPMDAYASVLAVECVVVNEVFTDYKELFKKKQPNGAKKQKKKQAKWTALELEVEKLKSAIKRVNDLLDKTDLPKMLSGSSAKKFIGDLEALSSTLNACIAPTSVQVQWTQVKDLLHKASPEYHLVPAILKVFSVARDAARGLFDAEIANEALELAYIKREDMETKLSNLLSEDIPLLLSRIMSFSQKNEENANEQSNQ